MANPVIALDGVELQPRPAEYLPDQPTRGRFDARVGRLAERLALKRLGCSVVAVAPGAAGWPFHSHRANDELFLVLAGSGELRFGAQRHAVQAGDLVGCPAGGPQTAHQLVNTGDVELRYLAVSSRLDPEICEYPDSGKVAAYADDGGEGFYHCSRAADMRDYWDGE
jgi:uncharacterized cupin superfamily protein